MTLKTTFKRQFFYRTRNEIDTASITSTTKRERPVCSCVKVALSGLLLLLKSLTFKKHLMLDLFDY